MRTFFTSDTHFGHKNVIKYCSRLPGLVLYNDALECEAEGDKEGAKEIMAEAVRAVDDFLIGAWNDVIRPDDMVYHLGDISLDPKRADNALKQLHGRKILLRGNHDVQSMKWAHHFERVERILNIKVEDQWIVLCHFPFSVWENMHKGWWHLHGHSHGTHKLSIPATYRFHRLDVGVDPWGLKPLSFDDVKIEMAKVVRDETPLDHHIF